MLFGHGLQKLLHWAEMSHQFPDLTGLGSPVSLGLATFAEFFCSACVVLGLGFRFALIPLLVTMGVALVMVHGADPWAKKELAAVYAAAFAAMFLLGPGKFSADRVLSNR